MMHFIQGWVKAIRKTTVRWSAGCGILGYLVLHPMVMLAAGIMNTPWRHDQILWGSLIGRSVFSAYTPAMLPWGLCFAVLSATVGFLYARKRQIQDHDARLQGVMELAGAACHQLNQPMQVVLGYAELLVKDVSQDDPLHDQLSIIIQQIDQMSLTLKQIRAITKYETMNYINGIKIVDIEKSSNMVGDTHLG